MNNGQVLRPHIAMISACSYTIARPLIYTTLAFALTTQANAAGIEYRSIDGSGNNPIDPTVGQSHTQLARTSQSDYADGIQAMSGVSRPSARAVSVALGNLVNPKSLVKGPSDYVWAWGQFLDHDLSISESAHPLEAAPIDVPLGDPWFDPAGTGSVQLPFNRTIYDLASGTGTNNPRQQINEITGWIDASNVYGSDPVRADALRKNNGSGKLKTSAGRLLPFNTAGLPNAGGTSAALFLAGDVRANEQVGLTALHTLFVREHNRLAKKIKRRNPSLSGDEIYQRARLIVGAQMQRITYDEYLPVLLGGRALSNYAGYKPWIDASIANEFSTALYRYGHSAIGNRIQRLKRNGRESRYGHLALTDAFFAPQRLANEGGIAPILRGLAAQVCQPVDLSMTKELRHFLFGPPGAGGMDLAALNIQRGRDHGLADYNATRIAYGLTPAQSFADISTDVNIQQTLSQLYSSVDDIDLWVGALAEDTYSGMVGELVFVALKRQFEALRDGDRFWYESQLDRWELRQVDKLSRIIKRNTRVGRELRGNVFVVR